jgi:hypothetical protein
MTTDTSTYTDNPALRPTVLVNEVMKTVYRPTTPREAPPVRPDATDRIARATTRAA